MAQTNKKPMFHKPKTTGEIRKVSTPVWVKVLSIVSLVLLLALTAFAIYGAATGFQEQVALSPTFQMPAGMVLLLLPLFAWIIALGFRLGVRFIPLEMWRLPASVRTATIRTSGKYLKICTLLIELETVIIFGYVTYMLYQRHEPGDIPILIWVTVVAATVIFFGRYVLIAADRTQ